MKHVLVTILNTEDIAAVSETVKFLKLVKPKDVLVLSNPSLGITQKSVTQEIDKQISDLENAEKEASIRRDHDGAKQFSVQVEEAKTRRITVLRDGWKQVSENERYKIYDTLFMDDFANSLRPLNVWTGNIPLSEDITYDNLHNTLANIGSSWPENRLPKGLYSIIQPQGVQSLTVQTAPPEPVSAALKVTTAPIKKKPPQSAPVKQLSTRAAREKQLKQFFSLKKAAIAHGILWEGRPSKDIFEEVISKEFPEAFAA